MTDSELNKLLNSLLFNVEFPDANNIQYIYMYNNAKRFSKLLSRLRATN